MPEPPPPTDLQRRANDDQLASARREPDAGREPDTTRGAESHAGGGGTPVASLCDMKRALLTALVLCAACDNFSAPPPASMPWLRGFNTVAAADTPSAQASRRIAGLLEANAEDDYGSLELRADLAGDTRPEAILASYRLGVAVADDAGRLVARASGFEANGSADDLISLAVGDGQLGSPVIVLALQTGGHRESTIWIAIYRMTGRRALEQLFHGAIEIHEGSETRSGALTFTRSGLLYRAPDAVTETSWTFDARRHRYIEQAPLAHSPGQRGIW